MNWTWEKKFNPKYFINVFKQVNLHKLYLTFCWENKMHCESWIRYMRTASLSLTMTSAPVLYCISFDLGKDYVRHPLFRAMKTISATISLKFLLQTQGILTGCPNFLLGNSTGLVFHLLSWLISILGNINTQGQASNKIYQRNVWQQIML